MVLIIVVLLYLIYPGLIQTFLIYSNDNRTKWQSSEKRELIQKDSFFLIVKTFTDSWSFYLHCFLLVMIIYRKCFQITMILQCIDEILFTIRVSVDIFVLLVNVYVYSFNGFYFVIFGFFNWIHFVCIKWSDKW